MSTLHADNRKAQGRKPIAGHLSTDELAPVVVRIPEMRSSGYHLLPQYVVIYRYLRAYSTCSL